VIKEIMFVLLELWGYQKTKCQIVKMEINNAGKHFGQMPSLQVGIKMVTRDKG
jgi:hypothetical protein